MRYSTSEFNRKYSPALIYHNFNYYSSSVCRKSKIIFRQDSKECKRLQTERQGNQAKGKQSRSPGKPFVLKVEEDGEEHFYEVVDNICALNQHSDDRKAFANLLPSNNKIPVT